MPGQTMFDKKLHYQERMDDIRKIVLFEPRGAIWHSASVTLPSNHPEADMGSLIIETTEYPAMSGSNAICVATVRLETCILPMREPVTELELEAPAGLIRLRCTCQGGKVARQPSRRPTSLKAICWERGLRMRPDMIRSRARRSLHAMRPRARKADS